MGWWLNEDQTGLDVRKGALGTYLARCFRRFLFCESGGGKWDRCIACMGGVASALEQESYEKKKGKLVDSALHFVFLRRIPKALAALFVLRVFVRHILVSHSFLKMQALDF